jgi:PhnB protein
MHLTPYLNFNGTCAEAMRFYEKALRGKITFMQTIGESPAAEHLGPQDADKIMHAHLQAGKVELMASDCPSGMEVEKGGNVTVSIHPDTLDEAERIFAELSEGGEIKMPIGETFWAERFGMAVDRFGTPWMVNYGGKVQPGCEED